MTEFERPIKLSSIAACYMDAMAIPFMYERLLAVFSKLNVDFEIIFVNDGSPDSTKTVLADLAQRDKRVIAINHSRNFGSQSAFTSGMKLATGDAVILLDGDLQDPPELIAEFFSKWREGFDVVYGVRTKRDAPLLMQAAYKLFYRVFRTASYVRIPLDAGDFSLIDRHVVQQLNGLPENNRFLRGLRAWVGFKQIGVPYVRPERMFGRSTNNLLKNLGWAQKAICSFSYLPLQLINWLAFACCVLSIITLVVQVVWKLVDPPAAPQGIATVITIVLFMGSVQLLSLSIIGVYLQHIYDETKRRPPFIVESIFNAPDPAEPQVALEARLRETAACR